MFFEVRLLFGMGILHLLLCFFTLFLFIFGSRLHRALELAQGLEYVHGGSGNGSMIHRDIKNVSDEIILCVVLLSTNPRTVDPQIVCTHGPQDCRLP